MPTCAMRKACTHEDMPGSTHKCFFCKSPVHSLIICFQMYNGCGDEWDGRFFCGPKSSCLGVSSKEPSKEPGAITCAAGGRCSRSTTKEDITYTDRCTHAYHMICLDLPCSLCPKGKGPSREEEAAADNPGVGGADNTVQEGVESGTLENDDDDDLLVVTASSGGSGSSQPPSGLQAIGAGSLTSDNDDPQIVPAPSSGSEVSKHVSADKAVVAGARPTEDHNSDDVPSPLDVSGVCLPPTGEKALEAAALRLGTITQVPSQGSASTGDLGVKHAIKGVGETSLPTSGGAARARQLVRNPYEPEDSTCPPGGAATVRQLAPNPYESKAKATTRSDKSNPIPEGVGKRSPRTRSASQKQAEKSSAARAPVETLTKVAPFDNLALQTSVHKAMVVSVKDTLPVAIKDALTKEIAGPGFASALSKASTTPALNSAVKAMVKETLATSVKTMVANTLDQADVKVTKILSDALKSQLASVTKKVEEASCDLKTSTKKMVDSVAKNKPAGKRGQDSGGPLAEATTARLASANQPVRDDIATLSSSLAAQGVAHKAEMQAAFVAQTTAFREDVLAASLERDAASAAAQQAAFKEFSDTHRAAMVDMQAEAKKSMEEYMDGLLNRASQFICQNIVDANTASSRTLLNSVDAVKSEMQQSMTLPKRQHETDDDIDEHRRRRRSAPRAPSRGRGTYDVDNIPPSHMQLATTHQLQMGAPNPVAGYPYGNIPGTVAAPAIPVTMAAQAIPGTIAAQAMHQQGVHPRFSGFSQF